MSLIERCFQEEKKENYQIASTTIIKTAITATTTITNKQTNKAKGSMQ